jgi:hypothetical protein
VKLHIDREICVRRVNKTQINVNRSLAPPKKQHKKRTKMNVKRALALPTRIEALNATTAHAKHAVALTQRNGKVPVGTVIPSALVK